MNAVIEQKLKELWQESLKHHDLATHAVMHLLLACHGEGTQNDFAKWCCKYSPGLQIETSFDEEGPSPHFTKQEEEGLPPGFANEPASTDWVC